MVVGLEIGFRLTFGSGFESHFGTGLHCHISIMCLGRPLLAGKYPFICRPVCVKHFNFLEDLRGRQVGRPAESLSHIKIAAG